MGGGGRPPGHQVVEVRIEPPAISNLFARGHRIRLDISSSNFPRFDVNPNTGEPCGLERRPEPAANTVHLEAAQPSSLTFNTL